MLEQVRAPATAVILLTTMIAGAALAQSADPDQPQAAPQQSLGGNAGATNALNAVTNSNMLLVPLVNNIPGAVELPRLQDPVAQDPEAVQRGMTYFEKMNCVGCHAANGAGGMGPSLSDASTFKYPTDPAALYLVISHGAPLGMPAGGAGNLGYRRLHQKHQSRSDAGVGPHDFPCRKRARNRTGPGRISADDDAVGLSRKVQQRTEAHRTQPDLTATHRCFQSEVKAIAG
jgi:mono/diheme cytochrome c family protein